MAKAGRFALNINYSELNRNLEVAITRVQRATRKATVQACEDIRELSLEQVPRDSGTLAQSFFYEVQGSSGNFYAVLGYGGPNDRRNPKGKLVSEYMIVVHEDLEARHPIGKAKFLEDPVKQYANRFGPRYAHVVKSEAGL